jgi:hypothetical protein
MPSRIWTEPDMDILPEVDHYSLELLHTIQKKGIVISLLGVEIASLEIS